MLETLDFATRSLEAYREVAPDPTLEELVRSASRLRGARVLHVNGTPYGGAVSVSSTSDVTHDSRTAAQATAPFVHFLRADLSDEGLASVVRAGTSFAALRIMGRNFYRAVGCTALVTWVALASACGDTMEADVDMNRDLDRVFEEASLVDRELDAHAAAVAAAADPTAIDAAEVAHRDAMGSHMSDLDHMLTDMTMYCRHRDTQERGRTHDMQAAMKAMRDEMERHRLAPRPDLPAARSEEEKHVRESRGMLRTMRDSGSAMRHEAGFYRCQHGNH